MSHPNQNSVNLSVCIGVWMHLRHSASEMNTLSFKPSQKDGLYLLCLSKRIPTPRLALFPATIKSFLSESLCARGCIYTRMPKVRSDSIKSCQGLIPIWLAPNFSGASATRLVVHFTFNLISFAFYCNHLILATCPKSIDLTAFMYTLITWSFSCSRRWNDT